MSEDSLIEETDTGLKAEIGESTIQLLLKQGSEMRVKVVYEPDNKVLFNNVYSYGWWDADNQRLHIRNQVKDALDGDQYSIDADWWADQYMTFIYELSEYVDEAQEDRLPSSVDVKRIIDNTERVVVHPGETTEWHVVLTVGGREATLEFDETDMSADRPKPLKEEYSRVFYETPNIEENEEWKEVRSHWQAIQDVADPVNFTSVDIAVEQFVEKLKRWIRVVDDAAAVKNGDETVWYDANNERGRGSGDEQPVLWVKRGIVQEVHDKLDNDIDYVKLAKELQTRGYTVETSERLQLDGYKTRFWFFDGNELEIDPSDVVEQDAAGESDDRSVIA